MQNKNLTVGCASEIKPQEGRVGLIPETVKKLTSQGSKVYIAKNAGINSSFKDEDYVAAGAEVLGDPKKVWQSSDLIVQVKEPVGWEVELIKSGALKEKILFTYLHLANPDEKGLTEALMEGEVTSIAYETVYTRTQTGRYEFPLLKPMSSVAGVLAIQMGAYHMLKSNGGTGKLLGNIWGIESEKGTVVIIGGGVVGIAAAQRASEIGSKIILLEKDPIRREEIKKMSFPNPIEVLDSNEQTISQSIKIADLLVGAVYINGTRAPKLVLEKDIALMKGGAVLVDVPIDQGGIFEGSKSTTHENPTFTNQTGQIYYCVANMPGAVPQTSSAALSQATEKYVLKLASIGTDALSEDPTLATGLNVYEGKITNEGVSKAHNLNFAQNPFLT